MEAKKVTLIQINWKGPYTLENLHLLTDCSHDYGIYQIYGKHPVYGKDVLLYIGKADRQTIGKRVSQENWDYMNDSGNFRIYAGRLAGTHTPEELVWSREIDLAEKLLIYVHKPAHNSKSLASIPEIELQGIHILNWGDHRDLLPELSGMRWTSELDDEIFEVYQWEDTELVE